MDSAVLSRRIAPFLGQWTLPVALEWPGGRMGPDNAPVRVRMHRVRQLVSLLNGQIGSLGDAYVLGELELEGSWRDIMNVAAELAGDPVSHRAPSLWTGLLRPIRSRQRHQRHRDARQVRFHYDLNDDFFTLWLDPRRVYSCAYFQHPAMSLAEAQEAKLEHICRKLQLQPGQRFLDVGAGWGGLLLWAAEHHGVQAHGITLSHDQHAHVQRQIELRGLQGRVQVQLLDYRDLPADASFDRIASVGMSEHVGSTHLGAYFAQLHRLLKPGGLLLNHSITAGAVHGSPLGAGLSEFIETHVFPGGELVHVSQMIRELSACGLELLDAENLRPHHARTLWDWSGALERRLSQARMLAGDAKVRAYRLYLAGSAMAFERGWLSTHQLLASKPDGNLGTGSMRGAQCGYPFNRSHM